MNNCRSLLQVSLKGCEMSRRSDLFRILLGMLFWWTTDGWSHSVRTQKHHHQQQQQPRHMQRSTWKDSYFTSLRNQANESSESQSTDDLFTRNLPSADTKQRVPSRGTPHGAKFDKPIPRNELLKSLRALQEAESCTAEECDALLASCVASDTWDTVLDVLDLMKEHGWTQTHATYSASLRACASVGNAASAYEIWQAMQHAQISPKSDDIGVLLPALCRQAQHESKWYTTALQVLEEFKPVHEVPMPAIDAMLREMMYRKEWRRALRLLQMIVDRHHPEPTAESFLYTIKCCVWAKQPEQAAQILSSSLGYPAMASNKETVQELFGLVIPSLAQKGHWRKALQMLNTFEERGYPPTMTMYNPIMVALGRAKEMSQAKQLMRRLKDKDLFPDILTYNSLMAAAGHRWQEALKVLDECHREPGVEPDVYTYTAAIRACAKGGKVSRALTLFQVVQDKELPLDAYVYTAAMEACSKGKLWERSLELLQEMQDKGIAPTKVTYGVAITACGNAGEWERTLELLEKMRSEGIAPNLVVYNSAITAIAKSSKRISKSYHASKRSDEQETGKWKEVMKLLEKMRADGLEPDGFSYSSAITCYGSEGRWKEALELIDRMRKGGPATRPNKIAYTAAIASCGRNGQDEHALELFAQMRADGLAPDLVAYNALFSALRVAQRADIALELWDDMVDVQSSRNTLPRLKVAAARSDDSVLPDIITVTNCIGALSADNTMNGRRNVDRVFREAVERGILMRNNNLDSLWEVDLSGLTLPVARAATRFILDQIATVENKDFQDLTLITGVGVAEKDRTTTLREYIQEVLKSDFSLPLESSIPSRAQGTVVVDKQSIALFLSHRKKAT